MAVGVEGYRDRGVAQELLSKRRLPLGRSQLHRDNVAVVAKAVGDGWRARLAEEDDRSGGWGPSGGSKGGSAGW